MRDLVRETRVNPRRLHPAAVRRRRDATCVSRFELMPGISRLSIDETVRECRELDAARRARPYCSSGSPTSRTRRRPATTIPTARAARGARDQGRRSPSCSSIADLCNCEYTDHGHCGILDERGDVDNDRTLETLVQDRADLRASRRRRRRAVRHDGRPDRRDPARARRGRVSSKTTIMSYAAKYASAFYGPFREAAGLDARFRRPPHLPDGSGQRRARRCARSRSTSTKAPTS